jgi:hypothetical protein
MMHGQTQIKCIRRLVEKPEGKGSFGRPRYREEDNVKMDLHEQGWKDTVLSGLL